jgi:hypothetical protein
MSTTRMDFDKRKFSLFTILFSFLRPSWNESNQYLFNETARRFDVREIGGCLALLRILEYRKELKCQSESIRASIT